MGERKTIQQSDYKRIQSTAGATVDHELDRRQILREVNSGERVIVPDSSDRSNRSGSNSGGEARGRDSRGNFNWGFKK